MPNTEDHKSHIEEQTGHLTLQLVQGSQHPISLMVDQYVIARGAAIQTNLGLDESTIRQVIQYALLQGMELTFPIYAFGLCPGGFLVYPL